MIELMIIAFIGGLVCGYMIRRRKTLTITTKNGKVRYEKEDNVIYVEFKNVKPK